MDQSDEEFGSSEEENQYLNNIVVDRLPRSHGNQKNKAENKVNLSADQKKKGIILIFQ